MADWHTGAFDAVKSHTKQNRAFFNDLLKFKFNFTLRNMLI